MPATAHQLAVEYGQIDAVIDTPRPRFSWKLKDARPGAAQTAYEIRVLAEAAAGGSAASASPVWESGQVESAQSVFVAYGGPRLTAHTLYAVQVRVRDHQVEWGEWTDPVSFATGFLGTPWSAKWIAPGDDLGDESGPCPFVRRTFTVGADVSSARLYASARGLMEVQINGQAVSSDVLSPGWTEYEARSQYVSYDVTPLVKNGANVIGAILGDGWFSGRIARIRDEQRRYGNRPQFLCELHITTSPGEQQVITDGEWMWTTGPVVASDIYDGETYDARLEMPGWSGSADGDESGGETRGDGSSTGWAPVRVVGPAGAGWRGEEPGTDADAQGATAGPPIPRRGDPVLDAKVNPPVRRVHELIPTAQTEPEKGKFVYDLGQNISGWARVTATGKAGSAVTLRFAEMLQADGTLYVENLRSALATDVYTPAVDGEFSWEPRFTFHGFRYVEISGVETAPGLEQITGIVLHNDMVPTGSFESSSDLINQLQSNIQWGQRGNYLEVPTDCPQRDERLGWTGDAQVFIPTGAYNFNVNSFFTKWQRDLVDAQGPTGTIPSIAPAIRYMEPETALDGGPAWSDAFVICPWVTYQKYGDRRILEESYPQMKWFVQSMERRSRGLIRGDEFVWDWAGYGDWVSMDAPEGNSVGATPRDLIGTGYFAHVARLLSRIAGILGRERDERELRDLDRRITAAFQAEYVTDSGRVLGDTQTSYVVALAFDLLPVELRQQAVDRLVRQLERRKWRLSTGFVGTAALCNVLSRFGRTDVAYRLLLQEEFPSWLYTVRQGATTMWERWNSYTLDKGFGPVSMNSFNHYAYGAIGDWMYTTSAGLTVDLSEPGEPAIRIHPAPGFGLTHASARLETPFGPSASSWKLSEDSTWATLDIQVPANAQARVMIDAGPSDIQIDAEGGESHLEDLVIHESTEEGRFTFLVAAGHYTFGWKLPATASLRDDVSDQWW